MDDDELKEILINIEKDIYKGKSFSKVFNVLGFGETTSVLEIKNEKFKDIVLKRVPFFKNKKECEDYIYLHNFYVSEIQRLGLRVAKTSLIPIQLNNKWSIYIVQEKFKKEDVLSEIIKKSSSEKVWEYVKKVLDLSQNIFRESINRKDGCNMGFDMQVENWVVDGDGLIYFDTATPLVKKNGKEQLNLNVFFRSVWWPIGFVAEKILSPFLLSDYYDFRKSALDMIANLYKEEMGDIIKDIIKKANSYMKNLEWANYRPFSLLEVKLYYKQNVFVWETYLKGKK